MHSLIQSSNEKFSSDVIYAKKTLKRLRRNRGLKMKEGAEALGLSLKNLEDIETTAAYGTHPSWDTLVTAARTYGVSIESFMSPGNLHDSVNP